MTAARGALVAGALLIIALAGAWWTTAGDWALTAPISFGDVFDGQARSFLQGRADIDCRIASGEGFVRGGKCYVYFGPVPALLRIPPMLAAPGTAGRWSRAMLIEHSWVIVALVCLLLIHAGHRVTDPLAVAYVLLAILGSTVVYMWSWPTAYVETISCAVAFGIASIYCLLREVSQPEAKDGRGGGWLVAATVAALLSFLTRANTGAGPLLAAGVVALGAARRPPDKGSAAASRRLAAVSLGLLAAGVAAFVWYNHVRFGTYFNAVPMHLHVQYDEARLRHIGGTLFHPEQSPTLFLNYLLNLPVFRGSYPWLDYRPVPSYLPALDVVDQHAGVFGLMPALAWLAWAGLRNGVKTAAERWVLLAPLVSLFLLSSIAAVNHRYVHEFTLLLIPAGVFGLRWAWATSARRWITMALAAWSIYANWALALVNQREMHLYISEEARDRHRATRFVVDRWLSRDRSNSVDFDYERGGNGSAPPPVAGLNVRLTNHGGRYRYDGERWQHAGGPAAHAFQVKLSLDALPAPPRLDLLSLGDAGHSDTVVMELRPGDRTYRVCVDHYSGGAECGTEFQLAAGRDYVFDCAFDRLNREAIVRLDGQEVLRRKGMPLHPWREATAQVNRSGAPLAGRLTLTPP